MDFTEFEAAVKEVAGAGALSFAARRALWLAFGPWEERDEMDDSPRTLTEPLRKRAELALACAKKVMKVWSAYDPEDKGPQELLKKANACLKGKLEADQLYQAWKASDYMVRAEEERYSSTPMAAIAAERAVSVVLWDEFLLEPRYAGADNSELDPYDWDTAWCAALAWSGRDEGAGGGQRRVEEMKFWAWYLEQAAQLLGIECFKFPKKAIKDFEEKQNPPKPVPKEVTLESLADFLGQGEYRCHYLSRRTGPGQFKDIMPTYDIHTMCQGEEGVCPKCGASVTKPEFYYSVNALEAEIPGTGISIRVFHTLPLFHCPNHPDTSFAPKEERINPKTALKRYLKDAERIPALLDQLKQRAVDLFMIGEHYMNLNGDSIIYNYKETIPAYIQGIRWLDREKKELEIDLHKFGPYVYFSDLTLDKFRKAYPEQVEVKEDGSIWVILKAHLVRCWLDKTGALERVTILARSYSRFCVEVDTEKRVQLTIFLMKEFNLSRVQAEEMIEKYRTGEKKYIRPLADLSRTEAERLCKALEDKNIDCKIISIPIDTNMRGVLQ